MKHLMARTDEHAHAHCGVSSGGDETVVFVLEPAFSDCEACLAARTVARNKLGATPGQPSRGARALALLKELHRTRDMQHGHTEYMDTWRAVRELLAEEVPGTVTP